MRPVLYELSRGPFRSFVRANRNFRPARASLELLWAEDVEKIGKRCRHVGKVGPHPNAPRMRKGSFRGLVKGRISLAGDVLFCFNGAGEILFRKPFAEFCRSRFPELRFETAEITNRPEIATDYVELQRPVMASLDLESFGQTLNPCPVCGSYSTQSYTFDHRAAILLSADEKAPVQIAWQNPFLTFVNEEFAAFLDEHADANLGFEEVEFYDPAIHPARLEAMKRKWQEEQGADGLV